MPAKKPAGLIQRHETAAEVAERAQNEDAMRPQRALPMNPPARLDGFKVAQSVWRRMMKRYSELEAEIVTSLDLDMLLDYCILLEQVVELDKMRKSAYQVWEKLDEAMENLDEETPAKEQFKLWLQVGGALSEAVKLDGRVDRKRALLLQWRQSLYLTPRSRAGTAPTKKEKEEPPDDLETLLDDVTSYVNG
jgi:phage terminase small subunit